MAVVHRRLIVSRLKTWPNSRRQGSRATGPTHGKHLRWPVGASRCSKLYVLGIRLRTSRKERANKKHHWCPLSQLSSNWGPLRWIVIFHNLDTRYFCFGVRWAHHISLGLLYCGLGIIVAHTDFQSLQGLACCESAKLICWTTGSSKCMELPWLFSFQPPIWHVFAISIYFNYVSCFTNWNIWTTGCKNTIILHVHTGFSSKLQVRQIAITIAGSYFSEGRCLV